MLALSLQTSRDGQHGTRNGFPKEERMKEIYGEGKAKESMGIIEEAIKSQRQSIKMMEGAIAGERWQGNAHIAKVIEDMARKNSSS